MLGARGKERQLKRGRFLESSALTGPLTARPSRWLFRDDEAKANPTLNRSWNFGFFSEERGQIRVCDFIKKVSVQEGFQKQFLKGSRKYSLKDFQKGSRKDPRK